ESRVLPRVPRMLLEILHPLIPAPTALAVLLGIGPVAGLIHEPAELPAGHLRHAQVERPGDAHAMLGLFVALRLVVARRRTHEEFTGRDPGELYADRIREHPGGPRGVLGTDWRESRGDGERQRR